MENSTGKESTFISDPFPLDPGSHLFTIVVTDSQGESRKMQITINVPKNVMGLLIVLLLALLPVVAAVTFLFSRKKLAEKVLETNPVGVEEPKPIQCPSCKKRNVKEALYCEHCGTPLRPMDELEKKRTLLDLERRLKTREISEEEYHRLKEELEKSF